MSDGGKGSTPRPFSVSLEQYGDNFDRIFGRKKKSEGEKQADAFLKNEYYDLEGDDNEFRVSETSSQQENPTEADKSAEES